MSSTAEAPAAISPALAAPGLGSEVYGATVEKGEPEFESRWDSLRGGPDDGEDVIKLDLGRILLKLEALQGPDQADDAARKPAEVLAFMNIRPGETILELEGGRGWYSRILSEAIGPSGKLYAQYPPEFAYGDAAYKGRQDAGQLKNATIVKSHFDDYSAIADGSEIGRAHV